MDSRIDATSKVVDVSVLRDASEFTTNLVVLMDDLRRELRLLGSITAKKRSALEQSPFFHVTSEPLAPTKLVVGKMQSHLVAVQETISCIGLATPGTDLFAIPISCTKMVLRNCNDLLAKIATTVNPYSDFELGNEVFPV